MTKSKTLLKLINRKASLSVEGPNLKTSFSYSWLRDNCQCSQCVHPTTKQKLHSSGNDFDLIRPESCSAEGENIKIQWADHSSIYPLNWLKKYSYSSSYNPLIKPILWDAAYYEHNHEIVKYKNFLENEGYQKILNQVTKYGLAFIEDAPTENEKVVEDIANKFGVIRDSFYGRSWDVKNDPKSKNIAYTSLYLGLHMDLLYFESPPGLQLLHCLRNSVKGGTSLFYDVFGAVQRLKQNHPKYYEILCDTPVRFQYENDEKYFEYLHYTIRPDLNDGLQVFYSPPFQGPLHAPAALVNDFYRAFAAFEKLLADERYLYKHLLKPGQVVIFANRRVLHGRESFDHASGERWLKGTYVGWDEFKDRVRINFGGSSIEEGVELSSNFPRDTETPYYKSYNTKSPKKGKSESLCYFCNSPDHFQDKCITPQKCFKCGKPGHWEIDCAKI